MGGKMVHHWDIVTTLTCQTPYTKKPPGLLALAVSKKPPLTEAFKRKVLIKQPSSLQQFSYELLDELASYELQLTCELLASLQLPS